MNTSKLDQLRIERTPEEETTGHRGWWIVGGVALAALAALAAAWLSLRPGIVEVRAAVVREVGGQATSTVLNASGYVNARRQATVSSEMTGRVTEVLIEEGMEVTEGQVLARLDDANIRAGFDLAEARRAVAESALAETEALLREARANLRRTRNLVERQLASASELDRATALADSLGAQLARRRAEVEVADRNLAIWQEQLDDTVIRAPFSGVVVAKNAQPGEMISPVSAGGGFTRTGIGTIVDMESLEIEIDVNEAYINRVAPGQGVVATLDAYPDWQIPCSVIAIVPTADRQRATVEVRVAFERLDARILPDMGVKVAFQDSGQEQVAPRLRAIPASAVRGADDQPFVWLIENGKLERRAVDVAGRNNDEVLIAAGLSPGERVVAAGPAELSEGVEVKELQE